MTLTHDSLVMDWPLEPDPNHFAHKGRIDGGLANASPAHLQDGLAYINHRAQSDLVSYDGTEPALPAHPEPQAESSRTRRLSAGFRFWGLWAWRLLVLIAGGVLGVWVTENAFYIFGRTPKETRLLTIGVELLVIYTAYVFGTRMRSWPNPERRARLVAFSLLLMVALTALSVAVVRVLVVNQDVPHVSAPVRVAMFMGLALLLIVGAIDTGLHAGPKAKEASITLTQSTGPSSNGTSQEQQERARQLQVARHHQWMACQSAYLQSYRGAAGFELMDELERVKPLAIPLPDKPWTRKGAQP